MSRKNDREPFLEFHSGVNAEGKPFVQVSWGDGRAQLTPDQTRELGALCFASAEAAEMDATVFAWTSSIFPALQIGRYAEFIADLRRFRETARVLGEADYERIEEPVPLDREPMA
jgi:hypothetical protein